MAFSTMSVFLSGGAMCRIVVDWNKCTLWMFVSKYIQLEKQVRVA